MYRKEIEPFQYGDKSFRVVLNILDKELPLKYYSGFSEPDLWQRLYLATEGYLGRLKPLIVEAVKITLQYNGDIITLPILAEAYKQKLSAFGKNPFSPGFNIDEALSKYKYKYK